MNKTLLTLGVAAGIVGGTLAVAATHGPAGKPAHVKVEPTHQVLNVIADPVGNTTTATPKRVAAMSNPASTDLWESAYGIACLSDGTVCEAEARELSFTTSSGSNNQFLYTGAAMDDNGSLSYAWFVEAATTYTLRGTLSSEADVTVNVCLLFEDGDSGQLYATLQTSYALSEALNGRKLSFNVSSSEMPAGSMLGFAFIVEDAVGNVVINVTDLAFEALNTAESAEPWSEDTDLPGLGIKDNFGAGQTYIIRSDDGVTTWGLYYNGGEACITGVNTTAESATVPGAASIDGNVVQITNFGTYNVVDWSGSQSLRSLDLGNVTQVGTNLGESTLTDIYINNDVAFTSSVSGDNEIYLHIPHNLTRNSYKYYGFTRVLVGDEQPDYPEPSYAQFVIAGENEGDYFGIGIYDGSLCVYEIFTDRDSIALPEYTRYGEYTYYITRFGYESGYSYGMTTASAPNLRSVTLPERYNNVNVYWSRNNITDLYVSGEAMSTYWSARSGLTIHALSADAYNSYRENSNWASATVVAEGWEFDWMDINVTRRGEFAQTYIEMNDADWSRGMYVRVTGVLNTTDLSNMRNLTNLMKLDLSGADFTSLPQSWMQSMSSLQYVKLPENITTVPEYAFSGCRSLSEVDAGGITFIGNNAFQTCQSLERFDISRATYIGYYAFRDCALYAPAVFPEGLAYLGSNSFYNTGVTEVELPQGLPNVEDYAFGDCKQLVSVKIPSSVAAIKSSAFSSCPVLTNVEIAEGVSQINQYAFQSCQSLGEITLPSTLTRLDYSTFSSCSALSTVKCKAVVPPATNGSFLSGVDLNHCTLYIAPFTIDAYREANYWSDFYIMKALQEPVKNIYIGRPMNFNLLSEDNAVLQDNPNMTLTYSTSNGTNVGQLSAEGDGTLSAGVFAIDHKFATRNYYYNDYRTTLVNNAENMRADSVVCTIDFSKNEWHFVSFQYDIEMADITGLNGTDFVIREYNGETRATGDGTVSNWVPVAADGVLKAGRGYIVQAANNTNGSSTPAAVRFPSRNTVTKNNLFTSRNVIVELEEHLAEFAHNRSWNLVGNPYPCYYDMHALMDDFVSPVTLWRGSSYQAYSPVDDDVILRPNEAFFVQRPLDAAEMVFGAEGRMSYAEGTANTSLTPGHRAPEMRSADPSRQVFNFNVAGMGSDDRARIVINEKAELGYEINRDAAKFFAETASGIEIYVDGSTLFDICERPLADGKALLGMRVAAAGEYTLSLSGRNYAGWSVRLIDNLKGVTTDLTGADYTFTAEAGTCEGRFEVEFTVPQTTTLDAIGAADANAMVKVVNLSGVTVYEGPVAGFNGEAGIYIVVGNGKTYKVAVQ